MQNWPFSLSYNLFILLTHIVFAYESVSQYNLIYSRTRLPVLAKSKISIRDTSKQSERGFTQGRDYNLIPKLSNYFTFNMGLRKKKIILNLYVYLRISALTLF